MSNRYAHQINVSKMKKLTAGILAHVDSGKTTLSEALLYKTGVISSLGRVDLKNSYLDTSKDERQRGITIYSKNARIPLDKIDTQLILIDTPGHVDFGAEMERTLAVLDIAILLVSASTPVQAHTRTLWKLLNSYKIPTYIFVNKMDMPDTDKADILDKLSSELSSSVVDFSDASNEDFYENIATCDESLLDEYLNNGLISDEHIISGISSRSIFPVFFGSALKQTGIDEFIDGLSRFIINKDDKRLSKDFSGICYKIARDAKGVRLSYIKVLTGSIKIKDMLGEEKVNEIRLYSGEKYTLENEVEAGDICAIAGLANTNCGDIYGDTLIKRASLKLLPALSYAVSFPPSIDRNMMLKDLKELEEEDPSLNVTYHEETREILVYLMGDIHAEILKNNIKERFDINVDFTDGRVLYKETVDDSFEGVGHFEPLRHYAEAHIMISPNERGAGMTYDADISEDLLARNWQRLIYTHMIERNHRGVLIGVPITDINLSLVSGRAHIKHTEGGDFRQATYRAIRQGLMELKSGGHCHLLEPYYSYTLEIPGELTGRAMTDITAMSGTCEISETDINNNITVLTGRAPVSVMNGYAKEVMAYSKGLGKLYLCVSGYDLCHNEEEVLAKSHYDPEADMHNPPSSVFCSHGAGTIIPWYEVPDHMHIEYGTGEKIADKGLIANANMLNEKRKQQEARGAYETSISIEEIDNILKNVSFANEKGRTGSYKGISAASRERMRQAEIRKNSTYKGQKIKEKYILVDGYNVIHAWNELRELSTGSIDAAANKLNDILCNYQAIRGVGLMVVYDAYKVKGRSAQKDAYNNIVVVYTGEAQTADQYIERYTHENSSKYDITVVTSDGLEQIIVTGAGARITSSREFESEVMYAFKNFNEEYGVNSDE